MRKLFILLLAFSMLASCLAGCAAPAAAPAPAAEPAAPAAEPAAPAAEPAAPAEEPAEKARIAVICDTVGTNLFLTQVVDMVKAQADKYGYEYSVMECADTDEWQSNYEASVVEGYNLIVGVGWQSAEYAAAMADAYPDAAKYAVIDTDAGSDNVTSVMYNEEQAAYIMGVMAGAAFPTEKVYGYIGCFEGAGSWKYRWGFMEGVKSINPEADFIFNWTNSYTDTSIAYEYAKQQQAAGCTYIFGAAAAANEGIFQAALELAKDGKYIYSCAQDADATTPDNPYILSAQLKNTGVTMGWIIDQYFAGTLTPGLTEQKLVDNAIGATHITNPGVYRNTDILTDDVVATCKKAVDDIVSGTLVLSIPAEADYQM
ncbi:MAG: BMP family ABC transporter substrate-binding protein [Eubacteriales bacterium]|nr:BMP family ABC transporter substrate-binding protein [Eubacteriales bacterium]